MTLPLCSPYANRFATLLGGISAPAEGSIASYVTPFEARLDPAVLERFFDPSLPHEMEYVYESVLPPDPEGVDLRSFVSRRIEFIALREDIRSAQRAGLERQFLGFHKSFLEWLGFDTDLKREFQWLQTLGEAQRLVQGAAFLEKVGCHPRPPSFHSDVYDDLNDRKGIICPGIALSQPASRWPINYLETCRDLSILFGEIINSRSLISAFDESVKVTLGWHNSLHPWEHGWYLFTHAPWEKYKGDLKKFAAFYTRKDDYDAWKIAISLLSRDQIADLGWEIPSNDRSLKRTHAFHLLREGKSEEALDAFHALITKRGCIDARILQKIGVLYRQKSDFDTSLQFLEWSDALHPGAYTRCELGVTLRKLNRLGESATYLRQAIKLERKPRYLCELGITLHKLGLQKRSISRLKEAERLLKEACEKNPKSHRNVNELRKIQKAIRESQGSGHQGPQKSRSHRNRSRTS